MSQDQKFMKEYLELQCVNCAEFINKICTQFEDGIMGIKDTSFVNKYKRCKAHKTLIQLNKLEDEIGMYYEEGDE